MPPLEAEPLPHFMKDAALFDRPQKRRKPNRPDEEADLMLFMERAKTPDASPNQGGMATTSAACISPMHNQVTVGCICSHFECTLLLISAISRGPQFGILEGPYGATALWSGANTCPPPVRMFGTSRGDNSV